MRVRFADCELDSDSRRLLRDGREVHLSPKAFELLKRLVETRPRAQSKQELLEHIWPGVFVSDASLARAVNEIRSAIGDQSRSDGFVQTVHAFGYRFTSEGVHELSGLSAVPDTALYLVGPDVLFRLVDGPHLVGRELGVAIRLDSPRVSRHHARLTANGRDVLVEDLGSKNGTYVRGVRIEAPTRLHPDDEMQVGPIRLVLKLSDASNTLTEAWTDPNSAE
jgi:DNA-binding winged helix-turn-helix (wHTH) protein